MASRVRLGREDTHALAEAFSASGELRLTTDQLPAGCSALEGEVLFLAVDADTCEAFLPREISYAGRDPRWLRIFERGPVAGEAYLLASGPSFEVVFESVTGLLTEQSDVRGPRRPARALTDVRAVLEVAEAPTARVEPDALFELLGERIRGQEQALTELARAVTLHVARPTPRRPLSLFAIGPTGVGKTEASLALGSALDALLPEAKHLPLTRLDMSEYQEAHRLSQLLGAPQSYAGYGDGGALTDALAAGPALIVFDEIEKAHPSILRAIMNTIDAGRLSRPGRCGERGIRCEASIFYFTSNLAADAIECALSELGDEVEQAEVERVCRQALRTAGIAPELVGRMTSCLAFRPLSPAVRAEVVALAIAAIGSEYGLEVTWIAPEVVAAVLAAPGLEGFGARPFTYRAERLLGPAFHTALEAGLGGKEIAIEPSTPPRCVPYSGGA